MKNVLLLGAGKIGRAIASFLGHSGSYQVTVADVSTAALESLVQLPNVRTAHFDIADRACLLEATKDRNAVLSALPYSFNAAVAGACLETGPSYFDLTEDVATTREVRRIGEQAREGQIFMPQCGLAPGFVSIVAQHLVKSLEEIDSVLMRVGALPIYPTNAFRYNLTWSTDGLINEYCNPCEAIHEGENTEVLALDGLEHFSIDGVDYEAFHTSGGLGTLCETLRGKACTLNYKTVRYPGHRDLAAFLIRELKLGRRRALLKEILEEAIPITLQDVALVFCTVTGKRQGRFTQITDARKVYHGRVHGEDWSAIQITTASALCAAVDLHFEGKLPGRGFVRLEEIELPQFLTNRFGQHFELNNETPVKVRPVDRAMGDD